MQRRGPLPRNRIAGPIRQHGRSADVTFTQVLFGHTIEGMYSVPEYGGNPSVPRCGGSWLTRYQTSMTVGTIIG
jgi:hypothetical protein